MPANIWIAAPYVIGDGKLAFTYKHYKEGEGDLLIDENTLKIVGRRPTKETIPCPFPETHHGLSGYAGQNTVAKRLFAALGGPCLSIRTGKPTKDTPPTKLVLYKL